MHRLLLVAVFGMAFALPALAGGPIHIVQTQGPLVYDSPAGEFCNFNYRQEYIITQNIKDFLDADGNVVSEVRNEELRNVHTNLDTGKTLIETDHYTVHVNYVTGSVRQTGQVWHLRDEDGRLVLVGAGRFTMDAYTGEIISETPNVKFANFPQFVCPALGGAPPS